MEENKEKQDDLFQTSRSMYEGETSEMKEERETRNGLDEDTFGTSVDNSKDKEVFTPGYESTTYKPEPGQNYYTGTATPVQTVKKESKALEICALVFGIISLCGCCYGLFGIIGLVLSIIALATGKKSGLSIAGLICSILGIIIAVMVVLFYASYFGETFLSEFRKGFESGYESGIEGNDYYDDEESDSETSADNAAADTIVVNDATASVVVVNDKEITIPCTIAELEEIYAISAEDRLTQLDGGYAEFWDLEVDGYDDVVSIYVTNMGTEGIDASQAMVTGIWIEDEEDEQITASLYNGVSLGMSKVDMEAALTGISYDTTGDASFASYRFSLGDNEDYYYTIYVEDDIVDEIAINYYGAIN